MKQRAVLISGVSSGIGLAAAKSCIQAGFFVFGSIRKPQDAPALGENFHPLVLDVTDRADLEAARREVERRLGAMRLYGLVNNAGIAVPGPLLEVPEEELRRQFEVNFFAPIAVTREFAPLMPQGRVIMVSSISGRTGYPFLGAYAASKHALEGASESLRRELLLSDTDVILLCPGAIRTPIWSKSSFTPYLGGAYSKALRVAEGEFQKMAEGGLDAAAMGQLIVHIFTTPYPRVRYTPVPGKFLQWTLPRLLPARWLDRLIARRLGLR